MKKVCILLVVFSYVRVSNSRFKNPEMHRYSFFYLRARMGGWLTPLLSHFTHGELPVPTVQGAG